MNEVALNSVLRCGPVTLEPIAPAHLSSLWQAYQDSLPDLEPYMFWTDTTRKVAEMMDFIVRMQRCRCQGTDMVFCAIAPNRDHLATVGLHQINRRTHAAELGYWVWSKMAGRGIATACAARVLRYAFEELELHRIYVRHALDNMGSKAVIDRLGFLHEGTLRQDEWIAGQWVSHETYSMLEDEYRRRHHELYQLETTARLDGYGKK